MEVGQFEVNLSALMKKQTALLVHEKSTGLRKRDTKKPGVSLPSHSSR